jgi:hypothetical protein
MEGHDMPIIKPKKTTGPKTPEPEKVETFEAATREEVVETPTYDSTADTLAHIKRVQELIEMFCKEMTRRGTVHDASKLVSPEKEGFDKATPALKKLEYGTPEYMENLQRFKETIQHHYEHNSHHPEHYGLMRVSGMNLFDLVEMILDWKASSERMNDGKINLLASFERFNMDPQLRNVIKNTAEMLGWQVSHKD